MTQHSNQTTPNKLNILKQLEYCRLDRAAELLGCDVSDLIHFGVTERVAIYLFLKDNPTALVYFPKITDAFPQHKDLYERGRFIFDFNTSMRPFSVGIVERDDDGYIVSYESESEFKAELYGLWQLPPYILADIENDMLPDMEDFIVRVSAITSEGDFAYADLKEWEYLPTIHDCYLKNIDMMRLHVCFADKNKPLLRVTKSSIEQEVQARPLIENKPHHLTEHHAAKRELVLAAAIYAKNKWPEECEKSIAQWARTILDHEHNLFREKNDGKAPLTEQQIGRILNAAINNGVPYKSK